MAFGLSTAGNLKLFNMMMPLDEVTFDLNPEKFSVTKSATRNNGGNTSTGPKTGVPSPAKSSPAGYRTSWRSTTPTTIDFTAMLTDESTDVGDEIADATAIGGGVKARCDLLLQWTTPGGGSLLGALVSAAASALGFNVQTLSDQPILTLQWGDPARGFLMQGYLLRTTITYLRFDSIGNPTRAKVGAQFQEAPNFLLNMLTNPTSGGVAGRRSHVMRQGENLQSIATASYGRPQEWRAIAEANGIDDPLRVRAGRSVMLPPPAELH
jgi:nucleoid-associated protein YgaU